MSAWEARQGNEFRYVNVQGDSGSSKQPMFSDETPVVLEVMEFPNGVGKAFDREFFKLPACPTRLTD